MPIGPCAEPCRNGSFRRCGPRNRPRLGRDRRGRARRRDQRRRLRRDRRLRRPRLPDPGAARGSRAGRLDRDQRLDPGLGSRGDLVDALHRRQPRRALSLPGRHRLPRLLPAGDPRPLPAGPGAGRGARPEALDGRRHRRPRHRCGRGRPALRIRRRPDQRLDDRSLDHPRLSLRRRPPDLADRRHHRPHPLATGQDLDAAARRARGDGDRRRRLHAAELRSERAGRRLGRTDLPALGRPPRRRGLAARSEPDQRRRSLRRLAGNDRAGDGGGGDDRPRLPPSTSTAPAPSPPCCGRRRCWR